MSAYKRKRIRDAIEYLRTKNDSETTCIVEVLEYVLEELGKGR